MEKRSFTWMAVSWTLLATYPYFLAGMVVESEGVALT